MMELLLQISVLTSLLLTIHSAINRRFLIHPKAGNVSESVALLIPARNEEFTIQSAVVAALAQENLENFSVTVLNDNSTDGTAAKLTSFNASNFRAIASQVEPPAGWLGKPFACHRLAEQAQAEYLVFLDADVTLSPNAVAQAITSMNEYGLDLISPYPRQIASGLLNRLIQPLLQWSWLTTVSLKVAAHSNRPSLAIANGQFLICRSESYRKAGGHESIRAEVFDDLELLRRFIKNGFHGTVIDGTHLATCQMYRTGTELVNGYTKSLWKAFGNIYGTIAAQLFLLFVYVFPLAGLVTNHIILGSIGYLSGVAGRVICAQKTSSRIFPDTLAHPISILTFTGLTALSWRRHIRGTITWKERNLKVT